MPEAAQLGKTLMLVGGVVFVLGFAVWASRGRWGIGRLPGDIQISRDGFSLYIPLATMLLISIVLTLIIYFVGVLRK